MTVKEKLEHCIGKTVLLIFNTGKTTRVEIKEVTGTKVKYLHNDALLKLESLKNQPSHKRDIITSNKKNYRTCDIAMIKDLKGNSME